MDTKLTLKLNDSVIKRAKRYASYKNVSLSRLIENYLDAVTKDGDDDFEISPFVKSIATKSRIPIDADWKELKKDYINYLDKKYR